MTIKLQVSVEDPAFSRHGALTPEFGGENCYLTGFLPKSSLKKKEIGPMEPILSANPPPPESANEYGLKLAPVVQKILQYK